MACNSTCFGVLKGFMHPCHSHKKGKLGLGLGTGVTEVTVKLEDVTEAAVAAAAPGVFAVGLVEDADVLDVVDDAEGDVGLVVPLPLPLT